MAVSAALGTHLDGNKPAIMCCWMRAGNKSEIVCVEVALISKMRFCATSPLQVLPS